MLTEAMVYLLTGYVGGPSVDPDDYARQVSIWERKAELQREPRSVRTRPLPNTVWVRENF